MSIPWIATNPKANVQNLLYQTPMSDSHFEELCRRLIHETNDADRRLEILFQSKGFLSGEQAGHILSILGRPKDTLRAVMILEPRLVPMTCQQARSILAPITIHNDRLEALQYVKRALSDANTQEGVDYILSTFVYHEDKLKVAEILRTVVPRAGLRVAAGGHQGYAPLGGLYTSAVPNNPHIYGSVSEQVKSLPNHGTGTYKVIEAFEPKLPSIYADSASLANPVSKTSYSYVQGYSTQKA